MLRQGSWAKGEEESTFAPKFSLVAHFSLEQEPEPLQESFGQEPTVRGLVEWWQPGWFGSVLSVQYIQYELDQAITLYLSKARDLCWMDFSQHGLKWKLMPYRKSDVSLAKKFDPIISEVQVKHKESNIEKA